MDDPDQRPLTDTRSASPVNRPAATTPDSGAELSKGERTRLTIIQAAIDLFAERGWRGTGLAAIGERAGITHAAVLYHFGSSEQLLLAVLDERLVRFSAATAEAWTGTPETIIANIPEIARFNVAHPELTKLHVVLKAESIEPGAPGHDYFVRLRRTTETLYRHVLAEGVATGAFRADLDLDATAMRITSFLGGAETDAFLDPEQVDLIGTYRAFALALLAEIRAPG